MRKILKEIYTIYRRVYCPGGLYFRYCKTKSDYKVQEVAVILTLSYIHLSNAFVNDWKLKVMMIVTKYLVNNNYSESELALFLKEFLNCTFFFIMDGTSYIFFRCLITVIYQVLYPSSMLGSQRHFVYVV